MGQPGDVYVVRPRQRESLITCVSSGMISFDGETRLQSPKSMPSRRTIQRRNKLSRLHALPDAGAGKK